jgi:hypothetical protein
MAGNFVNELVITIVEASNLFHVQEDVDLDPGTELVSFPPLFSHAWAVSKRQRWVILCNAAAAKKKKKAGSKQAPAAKARSQQPLRAGGPIGNNGPASPGTRSIVVCERARKVHGDSLVLTCGVSCCVSHFSTGNKSGAKGNAKQKAGTAVVCAVPSAVPRFVDWILLRGPNLLHAGISVILQHFASLPRR